MKKILISFFFIWLLVVNLHGPAFGADVTLSWDPSQNATGYKLYLSSDNGITWDSGIDVGNVTQYVYPGVSETGLILFRVSAYNDAGEAIRYWSGAWYNFTWQPPNQTGGLGIE